MVFRALLVVCALAVFPNLAFAQSIEILAAPDLNLSAPDFSDPSIFSADPPIAIAPDSTVSRSSMRRALLRKIFSLRSLTRSSRPRICTTCSSPLVS